MALKRWRLVERRKAVGFSQEALAWRLGVDRTTIVRWEIAWNDPLPRLRPKLAEALRVTPEQLAELLGDIIEVGPPGPILGHAGTRGEEDPTNRRDAIKLGLAFAAGVLVPETAPRLGAADVERLRTEVRSLYELGARHGGGKVLDAAVRQLHEVRRLLDAGSYSVATERRLHEAVGELTEQVAWLAFDAGRHDVARRLFIDALALAELADSAQLKTLVLTSMTFQAVEYGEPREAVDLAEAAQRAARPVATAKLSSSLAAREAVAYARQGDSGMSGAALAKSERLLGEGNDPEDPDWVAFWVPANLHLAVADSHMALGNPGRAERAARDALAGAVPGYLRNESFYLAARAQALSAAGDVDEAVTVASEAVSRLDAISSTRARDRLRALRPPLEAHAAVPGVRDCLQQLARI